MRAGGRTILAATVLVTLLGCGGEGADDASTSGRDDRPVVVASIPPQASLVRRIGDPHVRVVSLLRPGDSPATHQPSDAAVSDVLRAYLYFRIGVPFENGPWLRAVEDAGTVRVVSMTEGLTLRDIEGGAHDGDHAHEGGDPHVWLEPKKLAALAKVAAVELERMDPGHARDYRDNLKAVQAELLALDGELRRTLAPYRGRRLYVYHPRWGYFCDAYGLEQVAVERGGKEPSEAELGELIRRAKEDGVRAIYVQPQIRGRSAEALAAAIGAEVHVLDPLAGDPIENLRQVARTIAKDLR